MYEVSYKAHFTGIFPYLVLNSNSSINHLSESTSITLNKIDNQYSGSSKTTSSALANTTTQYYVNERRRSPEPQGLPELNHLTIQVE